MASYENQEATFFVGMKNLISRMRDFKAKVAESEHFRRIFVHRKLQARPL